MPAETVARDIENLKRVVARAAPRMPGMRLRFPQNPGGGGKWITLRDGEKVELPFGTKLVTDIREMRNGWIRWCGKGEKPIYKMVRTVSDELPLASYELPERDESTWQIGLSGKKRDPWEPCVWLPLWNDNTLYSFQTCAPTGVTQIAEVLLDDVLRAGRWPRELPIVALEKETIPTRYGTKIPIPSLKIVGWTSRDVLRSPVEINEGGEPPWQDDPDDPGPDIEYR